VTPIRIPPSEWKPVEIPGLEPAAEKAVHSQNNTAVIAGPGAGKTEMLAQRACYLLQTGLCFPPRRILAISFKRDAAKNLRDRVERRCGFLLSQRFDSYTFDAFAKGLVDRFRDAIPTDWRPSKNYEINQMSDRDIENFIGDLTPPADVGTNLQLRGLTAHQFGNDHFLNHSLNEWDISAPAGAGDWAANELWRYLLRESSPSHLSFAMIGRLAELLLKSNSQVLRALRATYSHVFLDEFQDTTQVQYDLVKTAFLRTNTILSAVGDNKQRIMGWAGALTDAFEPFVADFKAEVLRPIINYRSAPELVRIQQHLIRALDSRGEPSISKEEGAADSDSCLVLMYDTQETEAWHLAQKIAGIIESEHLKPRDICVLVKQRHDIYSPLLTRELAKLGHKARVEAELQDLLAEPLTHILVVFLRLAINGKTGGVWSEAFEMLRLTRGIDDDDPKLRYLERELAHFRRGIRTKLTDQTRSKESLRELFVEVLDYVGRAEIRLSYPQYRQGDFYDRTIDKCADCLWKSYETTDSWNDALKDFEGSNSIPIMTIHKSKGLEYHTVIFLGLEDSAFWSFKTQSEEDKRAFFVAFSRAKKRVWFTYSDQRQTRSHYGLEQQGRRNIGELYVLLKDAGVKAFKVASQKADQAK
jgi:ATP-dependent DNA helicase UvrD/PcrA